MLKKNELRPIRSFVLRQGRLTKHQANAIKLLSKNWVIPFGSKLINWDKQFPNKDARKIIEIGFGMGATTAEIALKQQDVNFIGLEVHTPGVGNLLNLIQTSELTNLKIIHHDAVEVFDSMIATESLDAIHIFFPDPWHKKRHHKRRLIQDSFLRKIYPALKRNGYLHIATDWEDYASWIIDTIHKFDGLELQKDKFFTKPSYRPDTKYEKRGLGLGHDVWDILSIKR